MSKNVIELNKTTYYKRVARFSMWPLVAFILLATIFIVVQALIFHFSYIPTVLESINQSLSTEQIEFVSWAFYKMLGGFGVWLFAFVIMNLFMIYVMWNVRKLVLEIQQRYGGDADKP